MRAVIQRVTSARVASDGATRGEIGTGVVVLLGITHDDGPDQVAWMVRKIRELRIMRNERSVADIDADVLLVSQFTLYGDTRKGRRPTWQAAAPGPLAEPVYDAVAAALEAAGTTVARGVFGADMSLALVNDGPTTLVLETPRATPP